jgi:hypothetical protein
VIIDVAPDSSMRCQLSSWDMWVACQWMPSELNPIDRASSAFEPGVASCFRDSHAWPGATSAGGGAGVNAGLGSACAHGSRGAEAATTDMCPSGSNAFGTPRGTPISCAAGGTSVHRCSSSGSDEAPDVYKPEDLASVVSSGCRASAAVLLLKEARAAQAALRCCKSTPSSRLR